MILRLIEKHGKLTIEELVQISGINKSIIESEIMHLWEQGKICIDKNGKCYIPPKTTFSTMLLVTFLIFIASFILVGAMKASL